MPKYLLCFTKLIILYFIFFDIKKEEELVFYELVKNNNLNFKKKFLVLFITYSYIFCLILCYQLINLLLCDHFYYDQEINLKVKSNVKGHGLQFHFKQLRSALFEKATVYFKAS